MASSGQAAVSGRRRPGRGDVFGQSASSQQKPVASENEHQKAASDALDIKACPCDGCFVDEDDGRRTTATTKTIAHARARSGVTGLAASVSGFLNDGSGDGFGSTHRKPGIYPNRVYYAGLP
ncbi:unnamed protein product [Heligmosomoides polygyrus]|uniref:Uncharacterized protein n=1 Tax=Heligmosomoides polygyrus TaxID=6339 RepID=A0A183F324_HELPZ|nr:unnamed protein product [Heligmosomoides polygyrus]